MSPISKNNTIDFISTEEDRVKNSNGQWNYEYNLKDHLGNSRVNFETITGSVVLKQTDDYYPFGLQIARGTVPSDQNKYLYNKKELQEELGLYDYGARFYDPVVARWTSVDPLVELMQEHTTPYGYVLGNPIKLTDPDGRFPEGQDDPPFDVRNPAGNGLSVVENVYLETRDAVASGLATLYSGAKSLLGGGPMKEASVKYTDGQASLQYSPLTSTTDKLKATGGAVLGLSSLIPGGGPTAGLFAKAAGVKSSVTTIAKDALKVEKTTLAAGDALRIENAATKINKPISVVGSRASGTAKATSDWDYVIPGMTNKDWKKIKNSLPGAPSRIDNAGRNIDIFKGKLDKTKPHVTINPNN